MKFVAVAALTTLVAAQEEIDSFDDWDADDFDLVADLKMLVIDWDASAEIPAVGTLTVPVGGEFAIMCGSEAQASDSSNPGGNQIEGVQANAVNMNKGAIVDSADRYDGWLINDAEAGGSDAEALVSWDAVIGDGYEAVFYEDDDHWWYVFQGTVTSANEADDEIVIKWGLMDASDDYTTTMYAGSMTLGCTTTITVTAGASESEEEEEEQEEEESSGGMPWLLWVVALAAVGGGAYYFLMM